MPALPIHTRSTSNSASTRCILATVAPSTRRGSPQRPRSYGDGNLPGTRSYPRAYRPMALESDWSRRQRPREHPRKFVWADERFEWQSYTKDELTVHWYDQYPELGEHLVGFLEPQLERIEPIETSRNPVNVYIYGNEQDAGPGALLQRDTVNSYRAFNTVVSVMPEEIEGDELTALIHELAHFLVQDRAFNCFNGLPQWLEEGLAMLAEGGLSNEMRRAFAEARLIEQFIPLRSFDTPIAIKRLRNDRTISRKSRGAQKVRSKLQPRRGLQGRVRMAEYRFPPRPVQVRRHRRRRAETRLRD